MDVLWSLCFDLVHINVKCVTVNSLLRNLNLTYKLKIKYKKSKKIFLFILKV